MDRNNPIKLHCVWVWYLHARAYRGKARCSNFDGSELSAWDPISKDSLIEKTIQCFKTQGQILWLRSTLKQYFLALFKLLRGQIICPYIWGHCSIRLYFLTKFNSGKSAPDGESEEVRAVMPTQNRYLKGLETTDSPKGMLPLYSSWSLLRTGLVMNHNLWFLSYDS